MSECKNSLAEDGLPPSPPRPLASWYVQGLSDGLGDRLLMFDNSAAPSLELLRFRPDLAQVPGFEAALRERVHRLAHFRHPAFVPVRSVQRLEPDDDLALISNCVPGKRLSEVLHRARGPAFAAALIRQLGPALLLLQQHDAGITHGVLSPDRIMVSPEGRLTIVEHVVAPAIDALNLETGQLAAMGIAVPPSDGAAPRLGDVATDWYQLGLVALSVLIGRPVAAGELPRLETLLDQAGNSAGADGEPLSPFIREWLGRALQTSGTRIASGADAREALDELRQKEQPDRSGRRESERHEWPVSSVPATGVRPDELVEPSSDLAAASPVMAAPTALRAADPEPGHTPLAPPLPPPPPVQPPASQESVRAAHTAAAGRQHAKQARASSKLDSLSPFEREVLAGRIRPVQGRAAAVWDRIAPARRSPQKAPRKRSSISAVATLALVAVAEAGVIAWLAHAMWFGPRPAIVVEAAASGENVVVTSDATMPARLGLTVAPDLRWVRVSTASSDPVPGGKLKDAPAGTIRISSPFPLKVFEGARVLGSVPGADLKVPAGRHDLELVNAALGFRLRQALEVEAGQAVSVHVAPQHGWVTIDASPFAEVLIDGQAVGRTPLGPLPLDLGEHLITFRHPAGGSDRQRVTVKSEATTRVTGKLRF